MLNLWPATGTEQLSDEELARLYAYPASSTGPFVRVNFVSSLDGAVAVSGRSSGLSCAPDRRVFHLLRSLCDVVLVGAGTARTENYAGARRADPETGVPPRIAVVTRTAALDPEGRLFTDTVVAPLVLTSGAAPEANRRRLADAGAEVVELDTDRATALVDALADRGLRRVLCEGGSPAVRRSHRGRRRGRAVPDGRTHAGRSGRRQDRGRYLWRRSERDAAGRPADGRRRAAAAVPPRSIQPVVV